MEKINTLNTFLNDIKANGISKQDVNLIEDTVGENFISSIINIKTLTTERSGIGLTDVVGTIENYLADEKTESIKNLPTFREILVLHRQLIDFLSTFRRVAVEIQKNYNSNVRENLLNKKDYFTFYSSEGKESFVSNIFDSSDSCNFMFYKWNLDKLNLSSEIKDAILHNLDYTELENKITLLHLFIYKDNDMLKYFTDEDYVITNIRPTIKELFDAIDGWHMTTEGLENTINFLKNKYSKLSSGEYCVDYNNKLYSKYSTILNTGKESLIIINALNELIKNETV